MSHTMSHFSTIFKQAPPSSAMIRTSSILCYSYREILRGEVLLQSVEFKERLHMVTSVYSE